MNKGIQKIWDDFQIIATQEKGMVIFSNYDILKINLEEKLKTYNIVYSNENDLKDAEKAREELKKVKKIIKDKKDELKEGYMLPYEEVEKCLDELSNMVKIPLDKIDKFIKGEELQQKENSIKDFYTTKAEILGTYAEKVINSPAFFNEKWRLIKFKEKEWKEEITAKIEQAATDINTIQTIGGNHTQVLIARYFETLSFEGTKEFLKSLQSEEIFTDQVDILDEDNDDGVIGYRVLKIFGTEDQMSQLLNQLDILKLEFEEIEDGMPIEMEELIIPDFDSFVAYDIETTGTFGVKKGDAPAEITEIGAVRVINGEIVDHFSMLIDPGRKIIPRNVQITKITNEMVVNEPPISEVIKAFYDFVGDSILVGHNIKGCDNHFIEKAAKKSKFVFENKYLDTNRLASKFKKKYKWERVKLEYLSQQFGIELKEAHRAWCDAEATKELYFKLKEIYEAEHR